jgi:hypothetical protein
MVFDKLVEVPLLKFKAKPLITSKQRTMYPWMDSAITKWNILTLTDYEKVLFLDADQVMIKNSDELFELPTPAGCFSNPFLVKDSNDYYHVKKHGDRVLPHQISQGLHKSGFVAWGTAVLLTPSNAKYNTLIEYCKIHSARDGIGFQSYSSTDEQLLAWLYKDSIWHHIRQGFNAILWKGEWLKNQELMIYHYFGTDKPWEMEKGQWQDLVYFYDVARDLLDTKPELSILKNTKIMSAATLAD